MVLDTYVLNNLVQSTRSSNGHYVLDEKSKAEFFSLVALIDKIAPMGEDNRRDFWFRLPSVSFEEYKAHYVDDVESEEELRVWYESEYPDDYCWFKLTSIHHCIRKNEFFAIFLNERAVLTVNDPNGNGYPVNETDLIEFLLKQTKTVLGEIQKGTYNDWVKTQLPNRYRTGLISRKDYWDIYPDKRESFRRGFSEKEDEEFFRIIEIADVEAIPANRMQYVTARWFFEACQTCYLAAGYEPRKSWKFSDTNEEHQRYNGASAKEAYYMFADGRDDGLVNVPIDDVESFEEWLEKEGQYYDFCGGHPWEVVSSMSTETSIHLYVGKIDRRDMEKIGYYLVLSGSSMWRTAEVVKMYVALYRAGYPVRLMDAKTIAERLTESDYIGVVPDDVHTWYRHTIEGTTVAESVHLSDRDKPEAVAAKTRWAKIHKCMMLEK